MHEKDILLHTQDCLKIKLIFQVLTFFWNRYSLYGALFSHNALLYSKTGHWKLQCKLAVNSRCNVSCWSNFRYYTRKNKKKSVLTWNYFYIRVWNIFGHKSQNRQNFIHHVEFRLWNYNTTCWVDVNSLSIFMFQKWVLEYYEVGTQTAKCAPIITWLVWKHNYRIVRYSILALIMPHFLRVAAQTFRTCRPFWVVGALFEHPVQIPYFL